MTTSTLTAPPTRSAAQDSAPPKARSRTARADAADPTWARPAYYGLLLTTGLLYLWGLGKSGWANSFYSAAVQAGSESWKAFFFGSSDASNSITVDKTPLSLWPMELSVRLFGLSSWSILVPEALIGIATVALLHRAVRRTTGSALAGLIAGATLALTPVAVLMFRFNNPDAMLVLLLTGAGVATLRAVDESRKTETGRPLRWLLLGGSLVGLAFLAKMMQAFLVLPALALVYLVCAKTPIGKRVGHLVAAFGAMLVAGGWWVAIVSLWPASSRPYIGGSQNNSILELTLGYNGLGRLSGNETGSVGGTGGGNGTSQWGATGIGRLFNAEIGGQIAWLIPAALVLGAASLWVARRDHRIHAAVILWGTTLLVTGLTFSYMAGIFHAYYTVALAPSIAALVGVGGAALWRDRHNVVARAALVVASAATGILGFVLLGRSSDFVPWLRPLVLAGGIVAALGFLGVHLLTRRWATVVAGVAILAALAGPAAYAVQTASTAHTGSIPTAGPSTGSMGGPGGGAPGGAPGGQGGPGGQTGQFQPPTGQGTQGGPGATDGGGGGGAGGLLNGSSSSTAIDKLLETDSSDYTWVAAAIGSNNASGYQLATELPVMAIGGFNGSDPSPTLAQFKEYVVAGKIHYFIASGQGGGPSAGGSSSSAISAWVEANFSSTTVDGVTLYDLTGATS